MSVSFLIKSIDRGDSSLAHRICQWLRGFFDGANLVGAADYAMYHWRKRYCGLDLSHKNWAVSPLRRRCKYRRLTWLAKPLDRACLSLLTVLFSSIADALDRLFLTTAIRGFFHLLFMPCHHRWCCFLQKRARPGCRQRCRWRRCHEFCKTAECHFGVLLYSY